MDRTKNLKKNIGYSFLLKAIGIGLTFFLFPLTVNYLNEVEYGIWVTLFSVMNWVNVLDMGIGLGLRNKLVEALAQNDTNEVKEYISTGFISILSIGLLVELIFCFLLEHANMQVIFNTKALSEETLYKVTFWTGTFVISSFVLSIINQIYYAYQKAAITGAMTVVNSFVMLAIVYYLTLQSEHNLLYFVFSFGISTLLSKILFIIMFFYKRMAVFPRLSSFAIAKIKAIATLGVKFFVIQICTIIGFSFSGFMITLYLGPEYVRTYDIVFKVINISMIIQTLILTPLWSAYTDAYIKKDYDWIKNTFYKTCILSVIISVGIITIAFFLDNIIWLWMHINLSYSLLFLICMVVYHIMLLFVNDFCMLLNGVGKVDLQMYMWIIAAIVVVPITYGLIFLLKMNIEAIIIAMLISMFILLSSLPIQIIKMFKLWK